MIFEKYGKIYIYNSVTIDNLEIHPEINKTKSSSKSILSQLTNIEYNYAKCYSNLLKIELNSSYSANYLRTFQHLFKYICLY